MHSLPLSFDTLPFFGDHLGGSCIAGFVHLYSVVADAMERFSGCSKAEWGGSDRSRFPRLAWSSNLDLSNHQLTGPANLSQFVHVDHSQKLPSPKVSFCAKETAFFIVDHIFNAEAQLKDADVGPFLFVHVRKMQL